MSPFPEPKITKAWIATMPGCHNCEAALDKLVNIFGLQVDTMREGSPVYENMKIAKDGKFPIISFPEWGHECYSYPEAMRFLKERDRAATK